MKHTNQKPTKPLTLTLALTLTAATLHADPWITYQPKPDQNQNKHILLLAGDEEYRSEEALPMLAKILSQRHGFQSTVLFPIDPETGNIDPDNQTNLPGLHLIPTADLIIIAYRFREPTNQQLQHLDTYLKNGKPLIGLRTSTHAFNIKRNKNSPYKHYDYRSKNKWQGGFGQQILGDTWINHHGRHKQEATRALINGTHQNHPILNNVQNIFAPTDVYGIKNLKPTDTILLYGATLTGMKPTDPIKHQHPLMPLAWTRHYQQPNGKTNRIFCTTMGASVDFLSEDLRRLIINATYWTLNLEHQTPKKANVNYIGNYNPTFYGFGDHTKNIKPTHHAIK